MGPHLFHVDTKELHRLVLHLNTLKSSAVPYAVRAYTNAMAFEAQRAWKQEIPQKMVVRNKYTEQSIRVEKANSLSNPQATVGSIAKYMNEQEEGATETKKGQHGIPLPAAPSGSRSPQGQKKKPKRHQFKVITIMPAVSGHRSRQIAAALEMAKKRGAPQYAFLRMRNGNRGIFEINPGKKKLPIRKMWDLTQSSVKIPANPTMGPSMDIVRHLSDGIWREALLYQLRRHKILGY